MKHTHGNHFSRYDRWSYLWSGLGAVLLMLSLGSFGIAFAAWTAPMFLIKFFRLQRMCKGYILNVLGNYIHEAINRRASSSLPSSGAGV